MSRSFRAAAVGGVLALMTTHAVAQGPVAPQGPISVPSPSVLPIRAASYQAPANPAPTWQPGPGAPTLPTGMPVPSNASLFPAPVAPTPSPENPALTAKWKNGLFLESADKEFVLTIGGRAQFDIANYIVPAGTRANVPGVLPLEDGVAFRRVRLDASGTIYRTIDYYVQFDFVNGFVTDAATNRQAYVPAPTDVWVTFRELPFGNLRVGNMKPPISFEHLTSSRFLNFLERSIGFDAFVENFANGFQPGIMAFDTYAEKQGTWAVGVFKNTRSIFAYNVGPDEHEVDGRVTYLPVDDPAAQRLVHVGVGTSIRDLDDSQARNRSRMSVRNAPSALAPLIADTGFYFGDHQWMVIPELAAVNGPWSFQSEYYANWVTGAAVPAGVSRGTVFFHAVTAEVHYFLTGESREYDRDRAVFGRVVPCSNASWRRGCGMDGLGAWQLAARYSYLDLNDNGIEGGRIHDLTFGLNWFLNPNLKVQWNYSLTHRDAAGSAGDGYINSFGTRVAIDF